MLTCLLRNAHHATARDYFSYYCLAARFTTSRFADGRYHRNLQSVPNFKACESQQGVPSELEDEISFSEWRKHKTTPLKMKDLYKVGLDKQRQLQHARYLHRELRIRMAHAVTSLQSLPPALTQSAGVGEVIRRHTHSVAKLGNCGCPSNFVEHSAFTELLEDITNYHEDDLCCITEEVHRFARTPQGHSTMSVMDKALRKFLLMRIGTRLQVKHQIKSQQDNNASYSGVFQMHGTLEQIARESAERSAALCQERLGQAPSILVEEDHSTGVDLPCMPAVLSYILNELFKNACQAVVERYVGKHTDSLPPVRCHIAQTAAGLHVRISDMGRGISQQQMEKLGQFGHSSNSSPWCSRKTSDVLSGYGVGLSLCRLYAQYFGGDLTLSSEVGVGTDVFLRIAWSPDTSECLPS